jgi:hypothetical protein
MRCSECGGRGVQLICFEPDPVTNTDTDIFALCGSCGGSGEKEDQEYRRQMANSAMGLRPVPRPASAST